MLNDYAPNFESNNDFLSTVEKKQNSPISAKKAECSIIGRKRQVFKDS